MFLDYAQADFADGALRDTRYGDIYFNPEYGMEESRYVFLRANRLQERFAALEHGATFQIGETGFGSGMNFILSAETFLRHAPADTRLSYVSCEKHPLHLELLQQIQHHWPQSALRRALYRHYPHNRAGFHFLPLHPRIDLLLLFGDAEKTLPQLEACIDAWFLDGFAPAKNPTLWSAAVIQAIARCSRPYATLSTFSAARQVREQLQTAGFAIEKQPGFGRKREMTFARLVSTPEHRPSWTDLPPPVGGGEIAVIGAGLAGVSCAYALAQSGRQVTIFHDNRRFPAASQVPIAVPYLQPGLTNSTMRRFHLAAWRYNRLFCEALPQETFQRHDIVLAAENDKHRMRHRRLLQENIFLPDEASLDTHEHLILHGSGIFYPPQLLAHLCAHPKIRLVEKPLHRLPDGYAAVILATARHLELLPPAWHHQLLPLRGQAALAHISPAFVHPPYCGEISILPFDDPEKIYIGSAYQPNCSDGHARAEDNQALLSQFRRRFPGYHANYSGEFVAIRAATRDYLPLIGPLVDADKLRRHYHHWRFDKNFPIFAAPDYPRPHYLHAGLGSKGCLTTFFAAEILRAMLLGTPLPLERPLINALLPARTVIRDIIRRRPTD